MSNGWNPVSETGNDESVVVNDCDINMSRVNPNILVTGTPGVGKTRFASVLKKHLNHVKVINVGDFAKDNNLLGDWDEKYQSHEMKEEELLDALETVVGQGDGGVVVEHHDPDLFPERWFDLVLVLRCNNTLLYERLTSRGYSGTKLENNLSAEIFQTILDEARESYREEIVIELQSESEEDLEMNAARVVQWEQNWREDRNKVRPGKRRAEDKIERD